MKKILTLLIVVIASLFLTQTTLASSDGRWTLDDDYYYFNYAIGDYKIAFENVDEYRFEYTTKNTKGTLNAPYKFLTVNASDEVILRATAGHNYANYQIIKNGQVLESATAGMQGGNSISVRYKLIAPIDTGIISSIDDLPRTAGNPFDGTDQQYGAVRYKYNNQAHKLSVEINYNGSYVFEHVTTSTSFLDGMKQAFYYTKGNDKFIAIFYEDAMPLVTGEINEWGGFAIWNLKTNEIVITNKLRTLTLIELVGMDAYAYFYMPDIIVTDLLSVNLTYNYEIESSTFMYWGSKWSEKQTKTMWLTKDSVSEGSIPQYMYDIYTGSKAALAVGAVLSIIPGTQAIGLPLLLAGAGATGGLAAGLSVENHSFTSKTINDITKVIPDEALSNRLNTYYSAQTNSTITISPDNGLYHLYLGNFAGEGNKDVRISDYKYTEISFLSYDKVYTIEGDNLIQLWSYTKPNLEPGEDPNPTYPGNKDNDEKLTKILRYALIFLAVIAGILLFKRLFIDDKKPTSKKASPKKPFWKKWR